MPEPFLEIIGHRGNGAGPGENTVASCQAAIRNGADRLELDVQLIDGQLRHAHPPATTGDLLEETLAAIKVPLILHLKRRRLSRHHDRRVLGQLARLDCDRFVVSSFWPGTLTFAKRHHPQVRTALASWWLGYDLWFSRRLGVDEYHVFHRTLSRRAVRRAMRRGLAVIAFVPNQPRRLPAGVRGVMTDRIKQWRAFVRRPTRP